jgi:hypothetical protein
VRGLVRGALVALATLCVGAESATAQQLQPVGARLVSVGSRVRVFAPSLRRDRYVGMIDSLDVAEIVLDTAGVRRRLGFDTGPVLVESFRRVSIRTSAIEQVELSAGRTTRGSTIRGMIIGAIGGALLLGLGNLPEVNPTASDFFKGAPAGLAIGAIAGGAVGYALGGERWVPAQLPK